LGAFAEGALVVGSLAIRRLAVGKATIRSLQSLWVIERIGVRNAAETS
jgi:hypothetical protein